MSGLTIQDLEKLQAQNSNYQMELVDGEIIVMSPSGLESEEVDPRTRTLEVYRPDAEATLLQDGDTLTIPEVLPGWELKVDQIWAPEFD